MSTTDLPRATWLEFQRHHEERADAATADHRARREAHDSHPVEDFLFQYYNYPPAKLRRWHPGLGVVLAGAAGMPRGSWRFYRAVGDAVTFDLEAFLAERGDTVDFVRRLLSASLARPAQLRCFGLHEWAMVYQLGEGEVRHTALPLRLSPAQTDAVLEAHPVRCTHFDAFRFFTPPARPLNATAPTRSTQVYLEQPGCLHAGMDLYKWAFKLSPLVPSDLVLDAFALARDIRVLDMQASPYDLRALGYDPVPIETAAGKAAYVEGQRRFSARSQELRRALLAVIDAATLPGA